MILSYWYNNATHISYVTPINKLTKMLKLESKETICFHENKMMANLGKLKVIIMVKQGSNFSQD